MSSLFEKDGRKKNKFNAYKIEFKPNITSIALLGYP